MMKIRMELALLRLLKSHLSAEVSRQFPAQNAEAPASTFKKNRLDVSLLKKPKGSSSGSRATEIRYPEFREEDFNDFF